MIVFNNALHGRALIEGSGAEGGAYHPDTDMNIARVEDDMLLGGIVYQNFTGVSIQCHIASFRKDWVNKDLLWVAFDYPFVQLGCKKMFGLVPSNNKRAIDFNMALGFTVEAIVQDVYPDADCIVLSLRREDCRWLRMKPRMRSGQHGRQVEGTPAA